MDELPGQPQAWTTHWKFSGNSQAKLPLLGNCSSTTAPALSYYRPSMDICVTLISYIHVTTTATDGGSADIAGANVCLSIRPTWQGLFLQSCCISPSMEVRCGKCGKCKEQFSTMDICSRPLLWPSGMVGMQVDCLEQSLPSCRESFRSSTIAPRQLLLRYPNKLHPCNDALSYYRPSMDICSRPLLWPPGMVGMQVDCLEQSLPFYRQSFRSCSRPLPTSCRQKKARIKIRAEDYHQREDGGNMKNH